MKELTLFNRKLLLCTVKMDERKWLNKEQPCLISFHIINLLLDKELLPILKMLGVSERKVV